LSGYRFGVRRGSSMVNLTNGRTPTEQRIAKGMVDEVTIQIFIEEGSALSKELAQFADSIAALSPKIVVKVEDADRGRNEHLKAMHVGHWPCLMLVKDDFARIRYYGVPGGYETQALVDAVVELSSSSPHLSTKAKDSLSKVRRKANVKVFVLTTCPFCPTVVRHAYRAAIGSPNVTTEVVDSSAFLELAARHSVMGVPKMVLNDTMDITGAVDEVDFFEKLHEADIAILDSMFG